MLIWGLSILQNILYCQEKNLQYEKYMRKPEMSISPLSLGYLFLVLLLMSLSIIAIVWILKKLTKGNLGKGKSLSLKESLYLGNKSYLHLVDIADKTFVLGVTPHSIQTIAQISLNSDKPCFEKILTETIEKQPPAIQKE